METRPTPEMAGRGFVLEISYIYLYAYAKSRACIYNLAYEERKDRHPAGRIGFISQYEHI